MRPSSRHPGRPASQGVLTPVGAETTPLGWRAPVTGPVHPKHVNVAEFNGLGWLVWFSLVILGAWGMGTVLFVSPLLAIYLLLTLPGLRGGYGYGYDCDYAYSFGFYPGYSPYGCALPGYGY